MGSSGGLGSWPVKLDPDQRSRDWLELCLATLILPQQYGQQPCRWTIANTAKLAYICAKHEVGTYWENMAAHSQLQY